MAVPTETQYMILFHPGPSRAGEPIHAPWFAERRAAEEEARRLRFLLTEEQRVHGCRYTVLPIQRRPGPSWRPVLKNKEAES